MVPSTLEQRIARANDPLDVLPDVPTRGEIERFGHLLHTLERAYGFVDLSTMHHNAAGLYGRSVVIKADTFLVGLPHKAGHLNVCVGDVTVWTEHGKKRLTGAHILSSEPGVMRVGFAHADTTWLSIHRNDTGSLDPHVIEDALVEHANRLMTRRSESDKCSQVRRLNGQAYPRTCTLCGLGPCRQDTRKEAFQ